MLSNEEKKAIEYFNTETITEEMHYGAVLVNLIEKKQKEIEELKDESKEYQIGFAQGCYEKDLDWEDKIKAKIEELDKEYKEAYNKGFKTDMVNRLREIKLMQSLLEKEEKK